MKILAIETSHDDTSLALYENKEVIWDQTISQTDFHARFGGTIPEYAARNHAHNLSLMLNELLVKHQLNAIDAIAYTSHPGLIGSLHMGKLFANGLSLSLNKPLYPINHLYGHIFAVEFTHKIKFPALALIVSGGHSQIWYVKSYNDLTLIGQTQDDALGEVYDKVARMLKLGFPGGPAIDKLAKTYHGNLINFKINPLDQFKLSFSGLKTKILNYVHKMNQKNQTINSAKIAASFQFYAIHYVLEIMQKALKEFNPNSIVLGGGVAANSYLRTKFSELHPHSLLPALKHTTDNASMIAITCDLQLNNQLF